MKRVIAWLIALFLLPFSAPSAESPSSSDLRALLIGSDTYLTKETTYPIAKNNLLKLESVLRRDARTYAAIHTYYDEIGHITALENAVQAAFSDADENDISLLYFSTHGSDLHPEGALYLSDGMEENLLSASELYQITSTIPGKKIILLDACNSGAFIQKGIASLSASHPFTGNEHILLTSSGGSEASWQWQGEGEFVSGSSYFADILCAALSGTFPSDTNRDGCVTVSEAFAFLSLNDAASTPQCYPESSSFPLFCYDSSSISLPDQKITDIIFNDTLLTAGQSTATFSFTVHQETTLYYQIVYFRAGAWDFENAQHFLDDETGSGTVSPGRKERSLVLDMPNGQDHGYAMLQFITIENGTPSFHGARLLCIQPARGELSLQAETLASFHPEGHEEMPILVRHSLPCSLSVTVKNAQGGTVKRLTYAQPTRPQQLSPAASTFYWDGTDNRGNPAAAGEYYIHIQSTLGDERITAYSAPFTLYQTIPEAP